MRAALAAAAGFLLVGAAPVPADPGFEIAFTMDDLPAHSTLPRGETRTQIAARIIAALKGAGLPPVYGFVNGVQLEREPAAAPVLAMWRAAGFPLGNHTWSHPNLNALSAEAYEAEIAKNEPLLARAMGAEDWHWFRYPFLAEGDDPAKRDAVRGWLAAHGYRIAQVTMSFGDYAWNEPYARCAAKGDKAAIAGLEASYLRAAEADIPYTRAMAHALYGRDIPYVLLMHIGALDSRVLPRLLAMYKAHGAHFVPLARAERDPAYREDVDPGLAWRAGTLEGRMAAKGLKLPPAPPGMAGLDAVCR